MQEKIKNNSTAIAVLLIWLFAQFICLMMSKENNYSKSQFYPFTEQHFKYAYDFTEFLIYGIGPIILFVAYKLISKNEKA